MVILTPLISISVLEASKVSRWNRLCCEIATISGSVDSSRCLVFSEVAEEEGVFVETFFLAGLLCFGFC